MADTPTIASIHAHLEKATSDFAAADAAYRAASAERNSAINHLNAVQKEFDAKLAEVRAAAPTDSDWKQKARQQAMDARRL